MKKLLQTTLLVLFLSAGMNVFSQSPPPPNGGNNDPSGSGGNTPVGGGAPIGGGLIVLLSLGAAYGGKKVYDWKRRRLIDKVVYVHD